MLDGTEDAGWYEVQYHHIDQGSAGWLDLPAVGVDVALYGSSAVVSNLDGLSWLRVRAVSCAGASGWSEIEQFGTRASDWEGVPVPTVEAGDETESCTEELDTPVPSEADGDNSQATGAPAITGTVQVGETLTADTSGIADEDGLDNVSYRYQWLVDNAAIAGATGSTYTLVEADVGKAVKVRVSFTDDPGNPESLTSAATDAVAAAPAANNPATGAPTITGTVQVGATLTADTSGIADADGLDNASFAYQWIANDGKTDSDITDATSSTYALVAADEGKTVKVRVSFTDDVDNGETLTSGATDAVAALGALAQQLCSGGGYDPVPIEVDVEVVPIVVESTIDEYLVLYVRYDLDGDSTVYLPVSVTLGQAGTTTLSENVGALPAERYRVEKYLVADPADVDGDCIDDITELKDPAGMNPVNPAALEPSDGVVSIPDQDTFEAISFYGVVFKFNLLDLNTDSPSVWFMNATTHLSHGSFEAALDRDTLGSGNHKGTAFYYPNLTASDGSRGVFVFWLNDTSDSFSVVDRAYTVLAASMPLLNDNLAYYMTSSALQHSQSELPLYRESRVEFRLSEDLYTENFIALNPGEGYGLLRVMDTDERPHARDIAIYETLPNELPRVAGIISAVPQTPLSHVNLRAVQDGVPNAFIRDPLDEPQIDDLIGSYVHYTVTENGWRMLPATLAEVNAHYAASRPAHDQTPQRDLSVRSITALSDIGFADWRAFGVKAANVAVLGTLGFPDGTVPDGFAVPFYFYDEFMKHNDLYDYIGEMLADPGFQTDFDTQESELKKLRKKIKKAETPGWMDRALEEMHGAFPEGTSLRYRSSTNNEDLPGFNGAGLYDSKTQHPEETEEDGIAKSLKQAYASLWNFRAFTEREFHRIDHLAAAMGVLVHPNYSDELANGVAVSFDPVHGVDGRYYVNTQLGEDLVTNPDALSVPEEILLYPTGTYVVLATSNQVPRGQLLMSDDQIDQLRRHLTVIHDHFEPLYVPRLVPRSPWKSSSRSPATISWRSSRRAPGSSAPRRERR